jgi:hypothetical protein
MVTYAEGVLIPGQISVALSRGFTPTVGPVDKSTGTGKNWVRGQIVFKNPTGDVFEVATAGSTSEEWGVATADAGENDPKGHCAQEGTAVAIKLAGAVVKNNKLKPATGGEAIGAAGGESSGAFCGQYLGHPEETDGKTPKTDGADNEVVYMRIEAS